MVSVKFVFPLEMYNSIDVMLEHVPSVGDHIILPPFIFTANGSPAKPPNTAVALMIVWEYEKANHSSDKIKLKEVVVYLRIK